MVNAMWRALLAEARASQFRDFEGAEAAFVLPVSDQLLTRLVRELLPTRPPLRDVIVVAEAEDVLTVQFRLTQTTLVPPVRIRLRIEQQPRFPAAPALVLRLLSHGIAALASPVARLFPVLPPGIVLNGDRLTIDVGRLLVERGLGEARGFLTLLEIHTIPHRLVVTVRGALPRAGNRYG